MDEIFYHVRDALFNFITERIAFLENLYYVILMIGVIIAYFTLRANTKAQRALRSPGLFIYRPEGTDAINGLRIKNIGSIIAMNINIYVSDGKRYSRIKQWLHIEKPEHIGISSLEAAKEGEESNSISIFRGDSKLKKNSRIYVKVTYYSPFFYNVKIKTNTYFKR